MVSRIEIAKAENERNVFRIFLESRGLTAEGFYSRIPPEPDILYHPPDGAAVAFELAEAADEDLSRLTSKIKQLGQPAIDEVEASGFASYGDPIPDLIKKKFGKRYQTDWRIHLLVYTNGRCITPDSVAIPTAQMWIDAMSDPIPFDAVWFMGDSAPQLIWEKQG